MLATKVFLTAFLAAFGATLLVGGEPAPVLSPRGLALPPCDTTNTSIDFNCVHLGDATSNQYLGRRNIGDNSNTIQHDVSVRDTLGKSDTRTSDMPDKRDMLLAPSSD